MLDISRLPLEIFQKILEDNLLSSQQKLVELLISSNKLYNEYNEKKNQLLYSQETVKYYLDVLQDKNTIWQRKKEIKTLLINVYTPEIREKRNIVKKQVEAVKICDQELSKLRDEYYYYMKLYKRTLI